MAIEYKKEGLSDREIARQLDIDNHTVAAYLKNVSLKQELPPDDPEADLTSKMDGRTGKIR
jgi:DNA-binding NarL/FixJ family response regulator